MHDYDKEAIQSEREGSNIDESLASSGSQTSVSKRARLEHYDLERQSKYDWLISGAVVGMLCGLCKKHKTIAHNGSSKWSIISSAISGFDMYLKLGGPVGKNSSKKKKIQK